MEYVHLFNICSKLRMYPKSIHMTGIQNCDQEAFAVMWPGFITPEVVAIFSPMSAHCHLLLGQAISKAHRVSFPSLVTWPIKIRACSQTAIFFSLLLLGGQLEGWITHCCPYCFFCCCCLEDWNTVVAFVSTLIFSFSL